MESADCGWEIAKGWTTYLYSSGLHGHSAHLAKKATVTQAREEVAKIAQGMIAAELEDPREEAKERLSCRLLVSNLAADAEEDDIREFFLRRCSRAIKILEIRDPVKRTRTAQLDMWTRNAAIRASFLYGSIFGLYLNMELAVAIKNGNDSCV